MKKRMTALVSLTALGVLATALNAGAQEAVSGALPLKDVVLFSSGVGYFQRSGQLTGGADIPLSFRTEQVNDILKSLVLFDPQGGVRPVTYTTRDATVRKLHSVGQSLNGSITLGGLLRQFQGAKVRLETGAESIEGRILSVSMKALPIRDVTPTPPSVVEEEVVNVLTEGGLQAVPLAGDKRVKLLDERLDRDLRESLELLATGLNDERREVDLHFTGNGAREVRAGYLQEMPVWKTSYRLVLDDKDDKNVGPYLQGWAIVENTTDEDWKNVQLSLVSGRPVSFIEDLYQPLYIPRPQVAVQVIGSTAPQTYEETLEQQGRDVAKMPRISGAVNGAFGFGAGRPGPPGPAGPPGAGAAAKPEASRLMLRKEAGMAAESMAKSIAAQATTAERGELFEYAISQPVTLPRQQAAMVPIVSEKIAGEKLSIYDPASDAQHALNGFKLKNSTGLHLSAGPVTVFAGGVYAGDAQVGHLNPGEDRLLSYAVDLDLVIGHENPKVDQQTLSVSAKSGVLLITRKQRKEQVYTFRNKAAAAKTVLVQQAIEPEFKLVAPEKPAEKTSSEYRFKVPVPAKSTEKLTVVTERPLKEEVALVDADVDFLLAWAKNGQVPEALRGSLKQLVERRRKITDLQQQRAGFEAELKSIDQEQSRIRQNMAQLDRNSALYQQYVKKLTDQETRIESVRKEIARLKNEEKAATEELRQFVDGIGV